MNNFMPINLVTGEMDKVFERHKLLMFTQKDR